MEFAIENGPFRVDLTIKDGDFPVRYVSLPEGMWLGWFRPHSSFHLRTRMMVWVCRIAQGKAPTRNWDDGLPQINVVCMKLEHAKDC